MPDNENSYRAIIAYLSPALATIAQTTAMHPLDTAAKKLQTSSNFTYSWKHLYTTLYPTPNSSLWNGYRAALTNRSISYTLTLGSQPLIMRYLTENYGDTISQWTGKTYQSTVINGVSGSICAATPIVFMPLDNFKLLRQMDNQKPLRDLITQHKNKLYCATGVTLVRNTSGFGTLYAACELTNQYLPNDMSVFGRQFISTSIGAIISTTVSNPTDVIKTVMQKEAGDPLKHTYDSAFKTIKKIYAEDNLKGFFRGLKTRMCISGPRIATVKALSGYLANQMEDAVNIKPSKSNSI